MSTPVLVGHLLYGLYGLYVRATTGGLTGGVINLIKPGVVPTEGGASDVHVP